MIYDKKVEMEFLSYEKSMVHDYSHTHRYHILRFIGTWINELNYRYLKGLVNNRHIYNFCNHIFVIEKIDFEVLCMYSNMVDEYGKRVYWGKLPGIIRYIPGGRGIREFHNEIVKEQYTFLMHELNENASTIMYAWNSCEIFTNFLLN